MKTRYLSFLLLAPLAQPLQAAELAGRIWFEANKQSASGVSVTVQCPDGKRHSDTTDRLGFFRVKDVPARQANCYIYIVNGELHADPLLLYSGEGRDTQNFSLKLQADKLIVRKY